MTDDLDPRIRDAFYRLVEAIPDDLQPPHDFVPTLRAREVGGLDPRVARAFQSLAQEIPEDHQPPAAFARRLRTDQSGTGSQPPVPVAVIPLTPHRARRRHAVTAALASAAAVAILLGFHTWNDARGDHQPSAAHSPASSTTPSASPSTSPRAAYALYVPADYPSQARCLPGPTVTPTTSPANVGKQLWWDEDPAITDPADDHIADRGLPLHSPAFDRLTEVGGCVQAWLILNAGPIPADAQAVVAVPHAFTRVSTDGLTEVYITHGTTHFVAASSNVTTQDLAITLRAAITP